jgi:CoA:oxalate CoA-transferase
MGWKVWTQYPDVAKIGKGELIMSRPEWADWADEARALDDPRFAHGKPEALDDILVLDLSYNNYAGCYCSSLLAEFGAEVIRIEPPKGDFLRSCTPYGLFHKGEGLNYLTEGRNKLHITLNLETQEGKDVLKDLASQADVLLETFKPGTLYRMGLGYEQLKEINPRLIFGSITTFGQFGPLSGSNMPDYDNVAQARSGIQYATGEMIPEGMTKENAPEWSVPTKAGPWSAWCVSGSFMAVGILAALHWRKFSGEGQALDVASTQAYMRFDDYTHLWYQGGQNITERVAGLDNAIWLYTFAPTKDGGVFLGGLRLEMWQAFCDIMGKWDEWDVGSWKDLGPFMKMEVRLKYWPGIVEFTSRHTSEELVKMSVEYSKNGRLAPITPVVAPIVSPEMTMKDLNWNDRGIFLPVTDPLYGEIVIAQAQYKLTETPIRTKWVCRPVGHDNEYVYRKYLGIGPSKLGELRAKGIV